MKNKPEHTATITKPKDQESFIKGNFEVVDGKLSFTCSSQNVTFEEVLHGITLLRDETQRQIDNQEKCPFHSKNIKS